MRRDLEDNFRDIDQQNKINEQNKIDAFQIIMGLILGAFFYFGYYMLMTEYFKTNPFKWPYILISIYFALASTLFAYANNRLSAWVENSEIKTVNFLLTPKTIGLIAYIFAPVIWIIELF